MGTGGAIRAALARCVADHVFIFNGDTYLDIEADEIDRLWQANRQPVIVVREVPDTARFGRVEMRDGRIHRFLEKGSSGPGLINAGCYVLPKHALDDFPLGQHFPWRRNFSPNICNASGSTALSRMVASSTSACRMTTRSPRLSLRDRDRARESRAIS